MSDFSLMPDNNKRVGNLPLSTPTLKLLAICFGVLVALFIGNQYISGKQGESDANLKNAQAEQQQMDLKTAAVKKQLGQLQASGGSGRLQLVSSLVKSQVEWRPIIMALIHASQPGIVYSGGFSGSASAGGSAAAAIMTLPLGGTAKSRQQVLALINRLKREKYNGMPVFSSVAVNNITLNKVEPSSSTAPAQPTAPAAPQFSGVTWTITLGLVPPPAAPEQTTVKPTKSSSGSGG